MTSSPHAIDTLSEILEQRRRRTVLRPAQAAVLVPILDEGGAPHLLLTRRTNTVGTHKGHVAFPGGRMDPDDGTVVTTALREAEEEVGLPPAAVHVLGLLDELPTVHDDTSVTPVVGVVRAVPPLRAAPDEVARIFTVPLPELQRPEGWRHEEVERHGRRWTMYYFDWDDETLWGLSAFIVLNLLDVLPGGAPFALPELRGVRL